MSTPKAISIPEEIQKPIRQRLQLLREAKKISKAEVEVVYASTLYGWEEEDLSSIKLSALAKLGNRYGMDFVSFIQYLFAADGLNILDPAQQYYAALPEEYKATATDMMRSLHSLSTKSKLADAG